MFCLVFSLASPKRGIGKCAAQCVKHIGSEKQSSITFQIKREPKMLFAAFRGLSSARDHRAASRHIASRAWHFQSRPSTARAVCRWSRGVTAVATIWPASAGAVALRADQSEPHSIKHKRRQLPAWNYWATKSTELAPPVANTVKLILNYAPKRNNNTSCALKKCFFCFNIVWLTKQLNCNHIYHSDQ